MIQQPRFSLSHSANGFTLLEVMVSLLVGTLIVGGIMGVISASLQFNLRLKAKSGIQPVLEAAAQEILADPHKAESGELILDSLPETPVVGIQTTPLELGGSTPAGGRARALYRVQLLYRGEQLEFSLIIPQDKLR
jgi:hypothetical protein